MSKLRIGAIGVGGMGCAHVKSFSEHPRVRVICICDLDENVARKRAEKIGADYTTDYKEVLERDDIDAVQISVPNPLHFPIALECVKAGKHTAVEYPITQTVAQYDTLCAEADAHGVVLLDILTPVLEPQPLKMKELAPRIGKTMTMRSVYVGGGADTFYVHTDRRGNYFAAFTIHMIAYYNVLLEESPDWVDGALHLNDAESFHSGFYMCHYPSGVLAFNEWHMGAHVPGVWIWVVEGEDGRLVFDRQQFGGNQIQLITRDGTETLEMGPNNAHRQAIESFVQQVLDRTQKPYVKREYGRDIIRICEAAQESADEGRRISLAK